MRSKERDAKVKSLQVCPDLASEKDRERESESQRDLKSILCTMAQTYKGEHLLWGDPKILQRKDFLTNISVRDLTWTYKFSPE